MKKTLLLALSCACWLGTYTAVTSAADALAGGDPAKGQEKSATCTACHGADGNSSNPEWPSLAGQHAGYIVKQLQNFKAGEASGRVNAMMSPMATPLSDEDMLDLGAYYASQSLKPAGGADPELVAEGELLYQGGDFERGIPACTGCHSPVGNGNPGADYPVLRGQHAKYTEMQLMAFRNGERANDPNEMMRQIADKMSDRQIQAVASYIQGLRP